MNLKSLWFESPTILIFKFDPSGNITSYSSSYAEYSLPSSPLSILKNSVSRGLTIISNKTAI